MLIQISKVEWRTTNRTAVGMDFTKSSSERSRLSCTRMTLSWHHKSSLITAHRKPETR
jgi:hypothetical protein